MLRCRPACWFVPPLPSAVPAATRDGCCGQLKQLLRVAPRTHAPHPLCYCCPRPCPAELLTQASRAAMAEMVHHIFSRLDVIPEPVDSPFAAPAAAALSKRRLQVSPVASRAENATTEEGEGGPAADAEGVQAAEGDSRAASGALPDGAAVSGEAAAAVAETAAVAAGAESVAAAEGAAVGATVAAAALDAGLSAEAAVDAAAAAAAEAAADAVAIVDPTAPQEPPPSSPAVVSLLAPLAVPASGAPPSELGGYGVDAVREVLLFIISLIGSGGHHNMTCHICCWLCSCRLQWCGFTRTAAPCLSRYVHAILLPCTPAFAAIS